MRSLPLLHRSFLVLLGLVPLACAGTLDDPQRFATTTDPIETAPPAPATPAPATPAPACGDVPKDVLLTTCATAGCHAAQSSAAALDLESPDVLKRLADKSATGGAGLLVDTHEPDKSLLYAKCVRPAPFGGTMPPSTPLDPAALECLRVWVATAAKAP